MPLNNALLGYSVNRGLYRFDPKIKKESFTMFFVTPDATAHYIKGKNSVSIEVKTGEMNVSKLEFVHSGVASKNPSIYIDNQLVKGSKAHLSGDTYQITLPNTTLKSSSVLVFK